MFLNAYYKLITYSNCMVARAYIDSANTLSIPQLFACNGTILTTIGGNINGYCNYVFNTPFAPPYKGMISQKTNFSSSQNTAYPLANIVIGKGTTPPVATDWALESEIYSGITYAALTSKINVTEGTLTYDKIMRNDSDSEITISELGLTWTVSNTDKSYTGYQILVYREVLDQPLVV